MKVEFFMGMVCSLFSIAFGVWLFDYILKQAKVAQTKAFTANTKLYLVSVTFIVIGLGILLTTIVSVAGVDQ